MAWELELVKFIQSGRTGFGDYLLYFITQFGDELFFMLAVMVLYWCVDKREGYRLVNVFVVSQLLVGAVKVMVGRTRPYYKQGVTPVMEQTDGYSFPSGHSNNIAVIGTDLTLLAKKRNKAYRFTLIASCVIIPLVMLSRIYLGQHYLTDVLVGATFGVTVGAVGFYLFDLLKENEHKLVYIIVPLCLVLLAVGIYFYLARGEEIDSLIKLAGIYSAVSIGYYLEKKLINYQVKSDKIWKYFVRFVVGAVIAIALKEGLKALFNLFVSGVWDLILNQFVRYFIIGIFATLLAPMMFKALRI